jgi:exosortase
MSHGSSQQQENSGFADSLKSPLMISSGVLALTFAPVLYAYLTQLWSREYYQFFPFAFAATLFFAATRTSQQPELSGNWLRQLFRVLLVAAAALTTAAGCLRSSPWLCYIGFALLFTCLLDLFRETDSRRRLLYLVLPVLMTVRPPLNLDEQVIQRLQLVTSRIASDFLNVLHIDHIREGNVIQPMVGVPLMVAEACSGVQSLFTVMFIAAFVGVSKQYSIVRSLLLMSAAVFWALLMNVGRVLTIAVAQVKFSLDLTTGWKHDAVGYTAMLLAIPFLLSTDRLIQFVFGGIPDDPRKYDRINVFVLAWNWLFTVPVETSAAKKAAADSELPWSGLTKSRKALVLAMAVAALLTALPAWVLPGFLRALPAANPAPAAPAEPPPGTPQAAPQAAAVVLPDVFRLCAAFSNRTGSEVPV